MIIAFDIDDTITRHPEFFSFITNALRDAGHTVLVITFRQDRLSTESDLREWNIAYDTLVTWVPQEHMKYGVNEWKAAICREHGVEIIFEDDPQVLSHFDDSVLCLMPIPLRPIITGFQ
jgi:hypothetical protein